MPNGIRQLTVRCTVCKHKDIDDINEAIMQGYSYRSIAIAFGLHYTAIARHKRDHLLTGEVGEAMAIISLSDVMRIPLQMKERADLIRALIDRTLEPLMQPAIKGEKISPIDRVQLGFLVRLFRIQQIDEQTILRVTGVLKEGEGAAGRANLVVADQYRLVHEAIEQRLEEVSQGNSEVAAQARLALAELVWPQDELDNMDDENPQPFTYTDLGPIGK